MSKILKNTTGIEIIVKAIGNTIPASSQLLINVEEYLILASADSITELTTAINAGDIVVNNGTKDLSSTEGIRYIQMTEPTQVEEGGVNKGDAITVYNFTGAGINNVTVDAAGKATIDVSAAAVTFGTEYTYIESEGVSATGSLEWQEKVQLTTSGIPAGDYRIGWAFEGSHDDEPEDAQFRIRLDGTETINEFRLGGDDDDSGYHPFAGFKRVTLTSGVHTFEIEFRETDDGTTKIKRARLEFWRVS